MSDGPVTEGGKATGAMSGEEWLETALELYGNCPLHPSLLCSLHDFWCDEPKCVGPCNCRRPHRAREHDDAAHNAARVSARRSS